MHLSEAYWESCQNSKMELSLRINNGWKPLTISAKGSILDVGEGPAYASSLNTLEIKNKNELPRGLHHQYYSIFPPTFF